jgi:superfamily I DNA/RNA helicase
VDFDDSVYRVYRQLTDDPNSIPHYELVLIDEFQDFNKMEAEIVNLLGQASPIIIAGDDDQALYSKLRGANWEHIRIHHAGGEYEVFMLPFCMRCPEVVVGAVNDVLVRAASESKLIGRIEKPFRYFAPVKKVDSLLHPHIDLVRTSVQSGRANYFGRYVEKIIRAIPEADFEKANEKHEPCVLVIGSKPYLPQVYRYLVDQGILADNTKEERDERNEGLGILAANPKSNLGWRILLAYGDQVQARDCIRVAAERGVDLVEVISEPLRTEILAEAAHYIALRAVEPVDEDNDEPTTPRVLLTSFEGSKGMSAQYVILVGLHNGDLPRQPAAISDIEVCKFLVGLTRTKKKCTIISCRRFGVMPKILSAFIGWVLPERFRTIDVSAAYWTV